MTAPTMAEAGSDWVEWAGGECPLAAGVMHERKYRDGLTGVYRQATGVQKKAWLHVGDENDIVAYRIVRS